MMKIRAINIVFVILCSVSFLRAQDTTQTDRNQSAVIRKGPETKFLLTGYAFANFEKIGDENSTFGPIGFSPIFLWRKSDRLFFEGEIEFELEDGDLKIGLEYATLHYRFNKYFTLSAGKFLSPFGIFMERLHPAWINKFAEKPLGFSHGSGVIGPKTELGASLRGGVQMGNSKINYVVYVSNGPSLNNGEDDPFEAGKLEYDNVEDNNNNKAIGGRIGYLPFKSSFLEIGFSAQYAGVGDEGSTYRKTSAQLYAGDLSIVKKIDFIKSDLDIKAQFNFANTSKADYIDTLFDNYSFDNTSTSWFSQLTIRPVYLENNFLRNIEIAARYSSIKTPEKSYWEVERSQITLGINYWLSWHSVIKLNYQMDDVQGASTVDGFFIQWGLGL